MGATTFVWVSGKQLRLDYYFDHNPFATYFCMFVTEFDAFVKIDKKYLKYIVIL